MTVALFCLHGWGGSKESWNELQKELEDVPSITLFRADLPGFGEEPEPKKPWTVDHYAGWAQGWIATTLAQEKEDGRTYDHIALIGHSHGGRIALKLAWKQSALIPAFSQREKEALPTIHYPLPATIHYTHLFLCAAAGIRRKRHVKRLVGLVLAKCGKWLLSMTGSTYLTSITKKLLYKLMRVHDYENASDIMQKTLINVTREDLTPLLSEITINTDLFWGEEDGMTPLEDGLLMERTMPHARLHRYAHCRHAVHREKAKEISAIIQAQFHL